jgi:ABC-type multidrug transport system, ATPase component
LNNSIIEVENLKKTFQEEEVLKGITCGFEKGKTHAIIGNNGSGKSVFFKCICGFIKPTQGHILVEGKEIGKDIDFPQNIGVIIERPGFLPNLSSYRNLQLLANLRKTVTEKEIREAIEKVGLNSSSKKAVSKYSMGMKQRLGIAQAIMEDPDILILDEPFNGLDKEGVREIRQIIVELKVAGKTIMLTSHNSEDIKLLADEVWEMEAGRLEKMA